MTYERKWRQEIVSTFQVCYFYLYKKYLLFTLVKKNYLNNEELKDEILKCITDGYNKAISYGFKPDLQNFISNIPDIDTALSLGYMPERTIWVRKVRQFKPDEINEQIKSGNISQDDANRLINQMQKPTASDKLGRMFQLIVDNVSRSFFWANPDDGLDCKANALFDLCSSFWKYEPVDANGKPNNAFAFCTQIAYFGIAGAHRILHPKKYNGTVSISCLDDNGKSFDFYSI